MLKKTCSLRLLVVMACVLTLVFVLILSINLLNVFSLPGLRLPKWPSSGSGPVGIRSSSNPKIISKGNTLHYKKLLNYGNKLNLVHHNTRVGQEPDRLPTKTTFLTSSRPTENNSQAILNRSSNTDIQQDKEFLESNPLIPVQHRTINDGNSSDEQAGEVRPANQHSTDMASNLYNRIHEDNGPKNGDKSKVESEKSDVPRHGFQQGYSLDNIQARAPSQGIDDIHKNRQTKNNYEQDVQEEVEIIKGDSLNHQHHSWDDNQINSAMGADSETQPRIEYDYYFFGKRHNNNSQASGNNQFLVFSNISKDEKINQMEPVGDEESHNLSTSTKSSDGTKSKNIYPHELHPDSTFATQVLIESGQDKGIKDWLIQMSGVVFKRPEEVNTYADMWQIVDDLEYYLYSAYYDDRPTLDRVYIRVIGILEVIEQQDNQTFCLLWYRDGESILAHGEKMKIGVRYPRHWKYFDPSLISCKLPINATNVPEYVSIITMNHTKPNTLLKVKIPVKPLKPFDFGVCVSVTYWRHEPTKVVEWLELHRKWGVQEVTVYNNSLSEDTVSVLRHYANEGFVDLRQAPSCMPDTGETTILMNMSPVINDCMYRNMYRYKKIVCVDFDEMIVPRNRDNYQAMIEYVDSTQPREHPFKTYMFRNAYFWFDFGPVYDEPSFLLTTRYLNRIHPTEYGVSVKCITDPLVCEGLQNHVCWHVIKGYRRKRWLLEVNPSVAMNQHYKKCHLLSNGECEAAMQQNGTEDRTMMRFDKELEYRVAKVLLRLNLLPKPRIAP